MEKQRCQLVGFIADVDRDREDFRAADAGYNFGVFCPAFREGVPLVNRATEALRKRRHHSGLDFFSQVQHAVCS